MQRMLVRDETGHDIVTGYNSVGLKPGEIRVFSPTETFFTLSRLLQLERDGIDLAGKAIG